MPNTHATLTALFTDIADAIRARTGGAAQIVADEFPAAIAAISGGCPRGAPVGTFDFPAAITRGFGWNNTAVGG